MTTEVCFNVPVIKEILAPKPARHEMTFGEIQALVARYTKYGWDERAIVTRSEGTEYQRAQPDNWGVVTALRKHAGISEKPYVPFTVRWVRDGSISTHWPEDLCFIHDALTYTEVSQILKDQ